MVGACVGTAVRAHLAETVWIVLKRFGYDLDIQLREDYLHPPLGVPRGSSTELSPAGMEFIIRLFRKYDEVRETHVHISP